MAKLTKILILESGAALAEIVDHFLVESDRFQVKRISPHSIHELCESLHSFRPDKIVMDDQIFDGNYTKLFVFLKDLSDCEIVVLYSELNHIHKFSAQHINLNRASDLVLTLSDGVQS